MTKPKNLEEWIALQYPPMMGMGSLMQEYATKFATEVAKATIEAILPEYGQPFTQDRNFEWNDAMKTCEENAKEWLGGGK